MPSFALFMFLVITPVVVGLATVGFALFDGRREPRTDRRAQPRAGTIFHRAQTDAP